MDIDTKEERFGKEVLKILLKDRTTNKNIIWATNDYEHNGPLYQQEKFIELELITGKNKNIIKPRVLKSKESKISRTKSKAEVFTPSWICNVQNNLVDKYWFGRENVFNVENNKTWESNLEKIEFPKDKTWKKYVEENRMEITCGEAPYLVSRYDTVTGEYIELNQRIGLLDRKLRIVNENTKTEKEWLKWSKKAIQSIYGFELQGDSLLIARKNILDTYYDNMYFKLNRYPTQKELIKIATIISWNLWQMDGLKYRIPFKEGGLTNKQMSLFDTTMETQENNEDYYCIIKDWKKNENVKFKDLLNKGEKNG